MIKKSSECQKTDSHVNEMIKLGTSHMDTVNVLTITKQ